MQMLTSEQLPAPAPLLQNNFLHHEIPEDFIMDEAEIANQDLLDQQNGNQIEHMDNNLQVGLVRIVENPPPLIHLKDFGRRPILFP